jgi:hypothetical protein
MTTSYTTQKHLESLPSFESIRSAKRHKGFMNRHRHCACGRPAGLTKENGRWHRLDACARCLKNHGRRQQETPPLPPVIALPTPVQVAA